MRDRRNPSHRAKLFWPKYNVTADQEAEGCSLAPDGASSPGSNDTDAILRSMTYVVGMKYPKYRLEERQSTEGIRTAQECSTEGIRTAQECSTNHIVSAKWNGRR